MAGGGSEPKHLASLSCAQCGKPAHLQCPKCLALKLPREAAAFCSQGCFKESWSSHKAVHVKKSASSEVEKSSASEDEGWLYCFKKGQARTAKLPRFDWTGTLRPFPISSKCIVPDLIDLPDWAVDGTPKAEPYSDLQHVVEIKTPEQIERMRETCRISREVLDAAARVIQPGITTDEIDRVVHEATIAAGAYPSPLNYYFFPKSCCTSVNEVICHGIPDARKLEDGDIVNVDVSVYYKGVHSDLNETYFVGNVDETSRKLVQCAYECLEKAISFVKPGMRFREIGEVISRHASMSGFSVARSYCGHGIGELFHCAPNIPHYSGNKAVGVVKAGQTFTIEPMINAGVWRDRMWPDGWTNVTADGKRSAQFEHTLLVLSFFLLLNAFFLVIILHHTSLLGESLKWKLYKHTGWLLIQEDLKPQNPQQTIGVRGSINRRSFVFFSKWPPWIHHLQAAPMTGGKALNIETLETQKTPIGEQTLGERSYVSLERGGREQ